MRFVRHICLMITLNFNNQILFKITPIQSTLARGLVRPNNELNAHLDPREKERLLSEQVT